MNKGHPPAYSRQTGASNDGALAPRKGFSAVPFLGDLVVFVRMLRDGDAHWGMKLLAFATLAYVISPVDFFPEALAPFIAWIDDVGIVLALRIALENSLAKYRYPLFEKAPVRVADDDIQVNVPKSAKAT